MTGTTLSGLNRIIVLGATGSGKTTFGRKLGEKLGVPATDLDDLHWLPGWVSRETADFYALTEAAAAAPRWVIVGNYSKVRQAVWPRADTFIWLDYPFPLVFWRLLRRSVLRAIDKNPVCNGNTESWRLFFSKDSIMVWLFKSYGKHRRQYGEIFEGAGSQAGVSYIRLRSPKVAQQFIDRLQNV